jgi:glycosyltransferase involved in cell wall biosynthesis
MWRKPIVFEATHLGHRLHFANLVASSLGELGAEPELWLPSGIRGTAQGEVFLKDAGKNYELNFFETPAGTFRRRHAVEKIVDLVNERDPFRMFLPTADGIVQSIGARSWRIPISVRNRIDAIVFRGPFAYEARSSWEAIRNRIIARINHCSGFNSIHRVDPISHFSIPEKIRIRHNECLLPEPIEDVGGKCRENACNKLGWRTSKRYLVALGQMNSRKGIDKLVRAFAAAKIDEDVKLVLAGPQCDEVQRAVLELSEVQLRNVKILDFVIPQDDFDSMLIASNWLAATYPRHIGSSGILLRGNQAERPVIASSFGWIGWATRVFNLGISCDVNCENSMKLAIESAANSNLEFRCTPGNRQLAKFHTVENFKAHYLRSYLEAHSAFNPEECVSWSSVERALGDQWEMPGRKTERI